MHRERRYQRHHAVRNRVRPPYEDQHRQRNAWPEEREDPEQHSKDSAQHDPVPSSSQISQHRWNSHISLRGRKRLPASKRGSSVQGEQAGSSLLTLITSPSSHFAENNYSYIARYRPPSTCKVPADSCFFFRQPLPSETKDRFSCFMPRP